MQFISNGTEALSVRDTVGLSMAHDPVARYIAKESHMAAFWDALISVYWSPKPRELHLMTKDCKSVVFARFHPEIFGKIIQAYCERDIVWGKVNPGVAGRFYYPRLIGKEGRFAIFGFGGMFSLPKEIEPGK